MQPEHISVGNLFAGEWTYTVPLFQRPYVWDSARWEPLWEDVVRVADEACRGLPKVRPHFLGSVVLQQRQTKITEGPRREVIDGQQRLTTLQLLLKAVADSLAVDPNTEEASRPLRRLLRNEDAPATDQEAQFKVWPTNVDRDRFRSIMLGDGTATAQPGDRLAAAYAFFRHQTAQWLDEAADDVAARSTRGQALSATLRQRLWLIALNLTADDQAQVIFETLNARGTPLLPADLIKNLLLRRAEVEGADPANLYETYWRAFDVDEDYWRRQVGRGHTARPRVDLFLVQFLTAKTRELVSPGQLYEAFSDWLSETGKDQKTSQHMAEIARYATIYRDLDAADDVSGDRLSICASRLRAMDFTTAMPVLLHLRADLGSPSDEIASADLDGAIVFWPATNFTRLALQHTRVAEALLKPGAYPGVPERQAVLRSVIQACDRLDGASDGVISNPRQCQSAFDPGTALLDGKPLQCSGSGPGEACLTSPQIGALRIMGTPISLAGGINYPGFYIWGTDLGSRTDDDLSRSITSQGLGTVPSAYPTKDGMPFMQNFADQFFRYFVARDAKASLPDFDPEHPGRWQARLDALAAMADLNDPDLSAFAKHGGKILMVHGTADQIIPAQGTEQYYQAVVNRMGAEAVPGFLKFYELPATAHSGNSLSFMPTWDILGALDAWVVNGTPPTSPIVTDAYAKPGRTQKLCEYPTWPKYSGTGSIDDAASFTCAH